MADAIRIVPNDAEDALYVHADHLGTPQKVADATAAIVWDAAMTPFGTENAITGTETNQSRFPGQYFDTETGLHYNWHRYYEPRTGRYITADPIGFAGGLNLYGYVGANPVHAIDFNGLKVELVGRFVRHPLAKPIFARHAFLLITPDNREQVQCMLRELGIFIEIPVTIGGYWGTGDKLIADFDAKSDRPSLLKDLPFNPTRRTLDEPPDPQMCTQCGPISGDSQLIVQLIVNTQFFTKNSNLTYDATASDNGYNSNSFAQGLLDSIGDFRGGDFNGLGLGATVGSSKPVPIENFTR